VYKTKNERGINAKWNKFCYNVLMRVFYCGKENCTKKELERDKLQLKSLQNKTNNALGEESVLWNGRRWNKKWRGTMG
jgi:hypothetical protein